jgi:outer membrane protein assembly factor BamB
MYRDPSALPPFVVTLFNERVIALDAETGEVEWSRDVRAARLLVDEAAVYLVSYDARVLALDYHTGSDLWSVDCGLPTAGGRSSGTILAGASVLFVSFAGMMVCVSKAGKLLWANELPGTGFGHAAIAIPGAVAQGDYGR